MSLPAHPVPAVARRSLAEAVAISNPTLGAARKEALLDASKSAPGWRNRDIPPFAALQAFEAVFRLGGIRKAAESLGVTHSVVSRHLKHLEAWLGTPVGVRNGHRLGLTVEGRLYHERVSAALAELAFATRDMLGEAPKRALRVWCMSGLSIQWLPAQLGEFEREYPDCQVELRPSDAPANLRAHEADINVHFYCEGDPRAEGGPGLMAQELVRPPVLIVCSPQLAREIGPLKSARDLLDLPLLHGGPHQREWNDWLTINGVEAPTTLPGPLCWNEQMALAAARQGRGLILASRFLAHRDLARGELVEIKVPGAEAVVIGSYVFVAREDRWSSPGVSSLRRFLSERMRSMEAGCA